MPVFSPALVIALSHRSWVPTDLGGKLRSWFRPDDLSQISYGAEPLVAGFARTVGPTGASFNQATASSQPTLGTWSGRRALHLARSTDHLINTSFYASGATPLAGTVPRETWAAFRLNALPTTTQAPGNGYLNHAIIAEGSQLEGLHVRALAGVAQVQAYSWAGGTGGLEAPIAVGGLVAARMTIATGQIGLQVNGGALVTASQSISSPGGFARIGGASGGTNSINAHIGDILFTAPLDAREAAAMFAFLARWNT